jgi:hypothetical protein
MIFVTCCCRYQQKYQQEGARHWLAKINQQALCSRHGPCGSCHHNRPTGIESCPDSKSRPRSTKRNIARSREVLLCVSANDPHQAKMMPDCLLFERAGSFSLVGHLNLLNRSLSAVGYQGDGSLPLRHNKSASRKPRAERMQVRLVVILENESMRSSLVAPARPVDDDGDVARRSIVEAGVGQPGQTAGERHGPSALGDGGIPEGWEDWLRHGDDTDRAEVDRLDAIKEHG